jgi:hypothetical protein
MFTGLGAAGVGCRAAMDLFVLVGRDRAAAQAAPVGDPPLYLKTKNPAVKVVCVEPAESPVISGKLLSRPCNHVKLQWIYHTSS